MAKRNNNSYDQNNAYWNDDGDDTLPIDGYSRRERREQQTVQEPRGSGPIPLLTGIAAGLVLILLLVLILPGLLSRRDRDKNSDNKPKETDDPPETVETVVTVEEVGGHTHEWGGWIIEQQPGCETEGVEARTCITDSSHVERQPIASLGHDWQPATYSLPQICSRCGQTEGEPAKETVPPTLDELSEMKANSPYNTVSNARVAMQLPTPDQMLSQPYRAQVYTGESAGRIYLMPIPRKGNGELGTIDLFTNGWIVGNYGPFYFFVADDGHMGWNGASYFRALG